MFGFGKPAKYENIDVSKFKEMMDNPDTVILDVRAPSEVDKGAIPGHLNINFLSLNFGSKIKDLDKEKTYLVYCRSGARSASACKKMSKLGFEKLYNLSGGILAWEDQ